MGTPVGAAGYPTRVIEIVDAAARPAGGFALAAVVAEAMDRRHLLSLVGIVDEPDVASCRVLEKCGFAFERPYTGGDGHSYRRYVRRSAG